MEAFCKAYTADAAPLASSALFNRLLPLVSPARQQKIARLIPPSGKRLSLGAGLLLRRALEDAGLKTENLRFGEEEAGKPFLMDYPELHFNLSHAASRVLCVLSSLPCGCDVEKTGRGSPALVRRFYAPEEQQRVFETPPEAFQRVFTEIWVRKESYLKATGEGFTRSPESFSVYSLPPSVRFYEGPGENDCLSALCLLTEDTPPAPEWIPVSFEA